MCSRVSRDFSTFFFISFCYRPSEDPDERDCEEPRVKRNVVCLREREWGNVACLYAPKKRLSRDDDIQVRAREQRERQKKKRKKKKREKERQRIIII